MRLSESIRKGGVGVRQIIGALSDDRGGHCAMGAALRAEGVDVLAMGGWCYGRIWPDINATLPAQPCPECGLREAVDEAFGVYSLDDIFMNVVHLNNEHRWTFDQIADWVQAQEAIAGIGQEVKTPELVTA